MSSASEALGRLSLALIETDPACQNDSRFTSDDHSVDLVLRLAEICATCPLFNLCQDYAEIDRPKAGIWAGRRYRTNTPRQTEIKETKH